MKVRFFCPLWGSKDIPFADFVNRAKNEGYDGVEISLPDTPDMQKEYLSVLFDYDMPYIIQHWQTDNKNVDEYISEYATRMEMNAHSKPIFINSQTGKDFFSFEGIKNPNPSSSCCTSLFLYPK